MLRPGGRRYSCEMTARFVDSRPLRAVSRHPADGDRPTPDGLAAACRAAGLTVTAQDTRLAGCWTALVATLPEPAGPEPAGPWAGRPGRRQKSGVTVRAVSCSAMKARTTG